MSKQPVKKEKKLRVSQAPAFWLRYKTHLLIFFSAFAIYSNSIPNNYNLDDEIVTRNHRLTSKGVSAIPEIFTEPYYKDASGYAYEYRPIVLVSFAIEHSLFGENAHISHFINVLLYSVLCVLLLVVLQMLFKDYGSLLALIATVFFVVHPAHTEVVDSIKNRDEILALEGALSALFFGLKWADTSKRYFIPISAFCFLLAVLSKQSIITWAVVVPIAIIFFRQPRLLPLLVLTIFLLVPVGIYVPLSIINTRIALLVTCLIIVVLFYGVMYWFSWGVNLKQTIQKLLSFFQQSFFSLGRANLNEQTTEFVADGSSFTKAILISTTIITLLVYTISAYCLFYWHTYLLVPVLSIYLFFGFTGNDTVKKILFIPCFILTMIVAYSFGVSPAFYTSMYLIISTVYFMYYKGQFRYVAVPVALACILISVLQQQEYFAPLFDILPIVLLLKKRFRFIVRVLALAAIGIGMLLPLVNSLGDNFFYDDNIRFAMVGLLLVVTYKPAAIRLFSYLTPAVISFNLFFLLAIMNMPTPPYYTPVSYASIDMLKQKVFWMGSAASKIREGAQSVSEAGRADLTDESTERPLSFIESPTNFISSETLKAGTAFASLSHYLYKIILPYPMSFYYGYRFIKPIELTRPLPLVSLAIYLFLLVLALLLIRKNRLVSFALLLFLVSVSVYSNYFYPLPGSIADRFMFAPSIGWCILLAYLILYFFARTDLKTAAENLKQLPMAAKGAITLTLLLYSGITFSRNFQWKDHITLFRHDIDYVNESAQAHNLLGVQLIIYSNQLPQGPEQFKMREEAVPHFKKSIEIYPDFFNPVYDAARVYTMINQPDSALVYYRKAAAMNPDFYESHLSAAEILARAGRWNEAIPFLEHVTTNYPTEGRAYDLLSLVYYQIKNYEKSIAVNHGALLHIPNSFNPTINIARVYETALNQPDSALYYYRKALQLNPSDAQLQQTVLQLSTRIK